MPSNFIISSDYCGNPSGSKYAASSYVPKRKPVPGSSNHTQRVIDYDSKYLSAQSTRHRASSDTYRGIYGTHREHDSRSSGALHRSSTYNGRRDRPSSSYSRPPSFEIYRQPVYASNRRPRSPSRGDYDKSSSSGYDRSNGPQPTFSTRRHDEMLSKCKPGAERRDAKIIEPAIYRPPSRSARFGNTSGLRRDSFRDFDFSYR